MTGRFLLSISVFGRPFVKRFALCYQFKLLSCPVCLSVTLVYCGQTVGWIKMKLGTEVGLSPRTHCVRWGPSSRPQKGNTAAPTVTSLLSCALEAYLLTFRPMYCSLTAEWIKIPLGMEVRLGPGHTVLDGDPAPLPEMGTAAPLFSTHVR